MNEMKQALHYHPESLIDAEWLDWYRLEPEERWKESSKLWSFYLSTGGSLDPEPDSQSPFDFIYAGRSRAPDGRSGLRLIRRC